MDVVERLSFEAASAEVPLTADRLHRYELAAELCDGLRAADVGCGDGRGSRLLASRTRSVVGVDADAASVDRARTTLMEGEEVRFEVADVLDFLGRDLAAEFDALVVLEPLASRIDPEPVLDRLARHARAGVKMIVAMPTREAIGEEGRDAGPGYAYDEAAAALGRIGEEVALLHQFNAEGSLIRGAEVSELEGQLVLGEHGEPEYCNRLIACVNFGPAPRSASSRMELAVAPDYNRRLVELERANRELSRANARLARSVIGSADSAASAQLERLERSEENRLRMERSVSWRITAPIRLVKGPLRRAFPRPWLRALAARVLPAPAFNALRALIRRLRQGSVDATRPR